MSNHELVELTLAAPGLVGNWLTRCSCGWTYYYARDALSGARSFDRHQETKRADHYTWNDMQNEYQAGYDSGFDDGEDEGRILGREALIEELMKLKEASDG